MDTPRLDHARPRHRLTSDQRQREIVAAVLALARERGPEAITAQAIADRMRQALEAALATAVAKAASPLAQLEAVFLAHVAFIAENPGVPRIMFHELQYPGDSPARAEVRSMVIAYRKRLTRLFTQAKAAGELPPELDAALAPVLFLGAIQGLVMQSALVGDEAGMGRRARELLPLLLHGYHGRRSQP